MLHSFIHEKIGYPKLSRTNRFIFQEYILYFYEYFFQTPIFSTRTRGPQSGVEIRHREIATFEYTGNGGT